MEDETKTKLEEELIDENDIMDAHRQYTADILPEKLNG